MTSRNIQPAGSLWPFHSSLLTGFTGGNHHRLLRSIIKLKAKPRRCGSQTGGRCEIRTHEGLATLPVFKTGAFNRSANLPYLEL